MTQSTHLRKLPSCCISLGSPIARTGLLFIAFALTPLTLLPVARAVSPPPDGGYANFNTAEGTNALFSLTTGVGNTAIGRDALHNDTTGQSNTATGYNALYFNTGSFNTADGRGALYRNTMGNSNTAMGYQALNSNTTGAFNTAHGSSALGANTQGSENTAAGAGALTSNTTGIGNTAVGYAALDRDTIGNGNTAVGLEALNSNISGSADTGIGDQALFSNTSGNDNVASGYQTLYFNTIGAQNTAVGDFALSLNTTGSNNIALGYGAGGSLTTGSNNIDIGNVGAAGESSTIRIGTTGTQTNIYIAGTYGVTVAGGIGVIVDSNGHLGTSTSSARYKENIRPMDNASEAIMSLKPVTFRYKKELDPKGAPHFGLIAEQVAQVNPDLVARDEQKKPFTVRYDEVNAMLLNEFLKEHRRVQKQSSDIAQLKSALAEQRKNFESHTVQQEKEIGALSASLQKICARLESSTSAAQVVADN